jgi:uncharacterized protein
MSASVIDAFELCRTKGRLEGKFKIIELPRLAAESVDSSTGALGWSLQGSMDKRAYPRLELSISGSVKLMCQRCLAPFDFNIASDSSLALAADEASADEMDALLADEAVEVIVGSKTFSVTELVEDEALLAIPPSPKHEVCPGLPLSADESEVQKASPFAVLKGLKQ